MTVTGGLKRTAVGGLPSWPRRIHANFTWGIATLSRPPSVTAMPIWRTHQRLVACALAAVFAIAAAMVVIDAPLAEAARHVPHWLALIFGEVTDFGKSGWFLWPTGLLLIAISALSSQALTRFSRLTLAAIAVRTSFLFIAIALPSTIVTIVKRLIGRARPFIGEHADPFLYKQLVWRPDYASMPSGHATTAFAAAVAIALIWPRLRIPMLIYAVLIATSRVVLDAHYVSDVVAGAVVGAVGALLVRDWFAARRLGFVIDADGSVRGLPGPSFPRIKRVARSLLAP